MKKLTQRYAIYVPSDFNDSSYDRDQALAQAETFLAEQCGGCTTIPAIGSYLNSNDVIVREEVDIILAYSCKDSVADKLRAFAIEACKRWHQESVAIEHSNALWLVEATDQPVF